jgi:hypothetical protein
MSKSCTQANAPYQGKLYMAEKKPTAGAGRQCALTTAVPRAAGGEARIGYSANHTGNVGRS